MTTATTEGRSLVLTVEGVDTPFRVDPLPAKRGKFLTDRFLESALGRTTQAQAEAVFIEALGPANYSRMSGLYVEHYDERTGNHRGTYGPDGITPGATRDPLTPDLVGARYVTREAEGDEPELDGEPIRQEEGEALCLAAFYWQTVVGMEAVNAFLGAGEGTAGSLKALTLLMTRLGLSVSSSSSSRVMEHGIQAAGSSPASDTPNSSASVRLPAAKRSIGQNPGKKGKRKNPR